MQVHTFLPRSQLRCVFVQQDTSLSKGLRSTGTIVSSLVNCQSLQYTFSGSPSERSMVFIFRCSYRTWSDLNISSPDIAYLYWLYISPVLPNMVLKAKWKSSRSNWNILFWNNLFSRNVTVSGQNIMAIFPPEPARSSGNCSHFLLVCS